MIGPITDRKCPSIKSEACCHTADTTLKWLYEHEISFLGKAEWSPNSPDLNSIENLGSFWKRA